GMASAIIEVFSHVVETVGLEWGWFYGVEELMIVFIGSLVYHEGLHILLVALALHPSCKVRLLLYGDASGSNPYIDSLKKLIAADDRVKLMGEFPIDEMGRVLETAHALAMPALWFENEPLVRKAARYIGLPVM